MADWKLQQTLSTVQLTDLVRELYFREIGETAVPEQLTDAEKAQVAGVFPVLAGMLTEAE